jgi:hypothetical protein
LAVTDAVGIRFLQMENFRAVLDAKVKRYHFHVFGFVKNAKSEIAEKQ